MSASVFKIRRKSDGLFSKGGTYQHCRWSEHGKSWATIGRAKSAMALGFNRYYRATEYVNEYADCEIVEFELKEKQVLDAADVFKAYKEKRK